MAVPLCPFDFVDGTSSPEEVVAFSCGEMSLPGLYPARTEREIAVGLRKKRTHTTKPRIPAMVGTRRCRRDACITIHNHHNHNTNLNHTYKLSPLRSVVAGVLAAFLMFVAA
jgi:hypothetical protein